MSSIFSGTYSLKALSINHPSFAESKGMFCGSLLKECPKNPVLISVSVSPVVMMSDVGWFPGHKPRAGSRSAFGGAFATGNSRRVTELQAGANGD